MGRYVEENVRRGEELQCKVQLSVSYIVWQWVKGILFYWVILIPTVCAIVESINFPFTELGVTDRRIIGKTGVFSQNIMDIPLNKIQSVSVYRPFIGRILGYGTIRIITAAGTRFRYDGVKHPEAFKNIVMDVLDQYEKESRRLQALEMANAINVHNNSN